MKPYSAYIAGIFFLLLSSFYACSKEIVTNIQPEKAAAAQTIIQPEALVEVGAEPVWVEFQGNSIRRLNTPEDASLKPFTAWPSVEYVVDMVQWADELAIAVNRAGFWLVKSRQDDTLELYFLTNTEFVPMYTMHKAFIFENKPVFLIYRNDFFGVNEIPPPVSRFFTINEDKTGIEAIDIPAFSEFTGAKGWDIEEFFNVDEDFWYFKAVLKGSEAENVNYVRVARLSDSAGEDVSLGTYMTAARLAAAKADGADDMEDEITENISLFMDGLPLLPENFVYTVHSQIGAVYITAWEERENWNTGAAGLLFTQAP
jgi:hypothetical protein